MGDETGISWADATWNAATGCQRISAGCDNCYAFTLAERYRGTPAWPVGFDPMLRPWKLNEPRRWKDPKYIFVNSMSDLHLGAWPVEYLDQIYDTMLDVDRHVYIVLTKRPKRMRDYLCGPDGFMARKSVQMLPPHIWLGTTIESDLFTWRADVLREIPTAGALTISAEPLLTALPSLNLDRLGWVIVGGESGPGFRPMPHEWARDLRDRCAAAGVPFWFKQSAAHRTEMGRELDGVRIEQRPTPIEDRAAGQAVLL